MFLLLTSVMDRDRAPPATGLPLDHHVKKPETTMAQKEERTADEIRLYVQQAVDGLTSPAGDVKIVIPPPQLLRDDQGAGNWNMPPYAGDKTYAEVVARVVSEAQAKYRLRVVVAEDDDDED